MTKSDFFGGLLLSSHVLKGTFASIFMNCQAVSFSLHAWFGVCSFLVLIQMIHNYGKLKNSIAIPKQRTLPHSLIVRRGKKAERSEVRQHYHVHTPLIITMVTYMCYRINSSTKWSGWNSSL